MTAHAAAEGRPMTFRARSLYEITAELLELDDALMAYAADHDGDITPVADEIDRLLAALGEDLERKVDSYAALVVSRRQMAAARRTTAAQMRAVADREDRAADLLEERLLAALTALKRQKVVTERFTVAVHRNGGKDPLRHDGRTPEAALPADLKRARVAVPAHLVEAVVEAVRAAGGTPGPVVVELDKDELRRALEQGEAVPGWAVGERGSHLVIR